MEQKENFGNYNFAHRLRICTGAHD